MFLTGSVMAKDVPPRYDEKLVRRFEPGPVKVLMRATLEEHGFALYFTRGLRAARLRDKHNNYKKLTWTELEILVDALRVKAGREPIFSMRKRKVRKTISPTRKTDN